MKRLILVSITLVFALVNFSGKANDFLSQLTSVVKTTNQPLTLTTALSQDQMVGGLKEALAKGVQHAVETLGKPNGFLTNINVKVPMPEKLRTVEKALRSMHQEKLADDFVLTMNRAAEQAVPEAAMVFADAVKQMTIEDGKAILTGGTNSATQFLRRTTETNLFNKFKPIVQKATGTNGVTSAYKKMVEKAGNPETLGNALGSFGKNLNVGAYVNKDVMDIDSYVTGRALDGLFKMVGEEEALIRENPAARSTELLQKVFGAVKK